MRTPRNATEGLEESHSEMTPRSIIQVLIINLELSSC